MRVFTYIFELHRERERGREIERERAHIRPSTLKQAGSRKSIRKL
jgi:hypothetical protein